MGRVSVMTSRLCKCICRDSPVDGTSSGLAFEPREAVQAVPVVSVEQGEEAFAHVTVSILSLLGAVYRCKWSSIIAAVGNWVALAMAWFSLHGQGMTTSCQLLLYDCVWTADIRQVKRYSLERVGEPEKQMSVCQYMLQFHHRMASATYCQRSS